MLVKNENFIEEILVQRIRAVSRAISSINTVLRANRSKYKNVEKLFFRSDDVFVRLFIASSDELFTEMIK